MRTQPKFKAAMTKKQQKVYKHREMILDLDDDLYDEYECPSCQGSGEIVENDWDWRDEKAEDCNCCDGVGFIYLRKNDD